MQFAAVAASSTLLWGFPPISLAVQTAAFLSPFNLLSVGFTPTSPFKP